MVAEFGSLPDIVVALSSAGSLVDRKVAEEVKYVNLPDGTSPSFALSAICGCNPLRVGGMARQSKLEFFNSSWPGSSVAFLVSLGITLLKF